MSLLDFMKDSPGTQVGCQPQVLNYITESKNESSAGMEDICLTDEQIHAFQEAFELFDKNGGGTIDAFELQVSVHSLPLFAN